MSTHDTRIERIRGATALPTMNCIVLHAKKDANQELQFYLFRIKNSELKEVTNFKSMCNHLDFIRLIPLEISGQEHLAATCWSCKRIDLYPLATKKGFVAFQNKDFNPFDMCAGANNKLYVHDRCYPHVFELDYSKPKVFWSNQEIYSPLQLHVLPALPL